MTMIAPYPRQPVEFQDYDLRAPLVARLVSNLIRASLPDITIEHVGSTAIPGCGGRGAIDLLILYGAEALELILAELDALGFQWVQRHGDLPAEWPKGMGAIEYDRCLFRLHLMVLPRDHPEVVTRCAFRNSLRASVELCTAYMAEKQAILAAGITDPIAYTAAKHDFVSRITACLSS
jgi:GrpB-like predicted nucleotidyltransferase (UPF0157 family)